MGTPMTVVETETFLASATRLGIGETERTGLIVYLAGNSGAGAVVPGTGGIRKLRWAPPGRGKSGGARAIYYYPCYPASTKPSHTPEASASQASALPASG
jgi:hypothetical protein